MSGGAASSESAMTERRPYSLGQMARYFHYRGAHLETGVAEDFRRCFPVLPLQVSEQHTLACADAARDRLTNRSSADNDNHIGHGQIRSLK